MYSQGDSPHVFWRPKLGYYSNQSKNAMLYVKEGKDGKPDKRKPIKATSYSWWVFFKKIGKRFVYNDYGYSTQTRSHQAGVREILDSLGVKYITINTQAHLDQPVGVMEELYTDLANNELRLKQPFRGKYADRNEAVCRGAIKSIRKQIKALRKCGFKFTRRQIEDVYESVQKRIDREREERREQYEARKEIEREKRALLKNSWKSNAA